MAPRRRQKYRPLSGEDLMAIAHGAPIDLVHVDPLRDWCHQVLASTEGYEEEYVLGYREALKKILGLLPPGR